MSGGAVGRGVSYGLGWVYIVVFALFARPEGRQVSDRNPMLHFNKR